MAKNIYKYNPETLNYEKVKSPVWVMSAKVFGIISLVVVFTVSGIAIRKKMNGSPYEQKLAEQKMQIDALENRIAELSDAVVSLEKKDDDIYREIFDAPMPEALKNAGTGGRRSYKDLSGLTYGKSLSRLQKRIDQIAAKVKVQHTSYDELMKLAKKNTKKLASIPAVMPIPNKDLKRMASGYGYRIDPFYKTRKFHAGMDFTAPTGTEIHATGDGVVVKVETKRWGYGKNIVIDHGYGYQTRYAHMSQFKVRRGDKVTRGQVLGLVGSTGKSTAPHLHYEVLLNGKAQNPANFYYNDLSDEQYEEMIDLCSHPNQSFD